MKRLEILVVVVLLFLSCSSDQEPDLPEIKDGNVMLTDLRAGQRSYFVRYEGNCGLMGRISYTGDTLLLEVIEYENELYFKESFTPGSPLFELNPYPLAYKVNYTEDYILLKDRFSSALFYFYGNDTLRTNTANRTDLVQNGCRLQIGNDDFIGEEIGSLHSFRLGNFRREDLTAVSCVPLIFEIDGYLMYDDYFHLSHVITPSDELSGWLLTGI